MVVVLANGRHGQGKNDHEAIVGRIPEEDMARVFDRLYAYNGSLFVRVNCARIFWVSCIVVR
jgi:hypothetical protein